MNIAATSNATVTVTIGDTTATLTLAEARLLRHHLDMAIAKVTPPAPTYER